MEAQKTKVTKKRNWCCYLAIGLGIYAIITSGLIEVTQLDQGFAIEIGGVSSNGK
jgi:hypothetical protein